MVKTVLPPEPIERFPHQAYVLCMGDLHIGSPYVDYERIKQDLDRARDLNADILINGDLLDAVLPKDNKRFTPTALHPRLQNRADVLNGAVDWAVELLSPYAPWIRVIGTGNHETVIEKYHSLDPISLIVGELNRSHAGSVDYGGYCGFFRRSWVYGQRKYFTLTLYRHHGSGGASPVTKGIIDFARMLAFIDADVIVLGHKHNRLVEGSARRIRLNAGGEVVQDPVLCVMAGAYMNTYNEQSSEDALTHGRRGNYAHEWNCAPQQPGGVFLRVELSGPGMRIRAEV